MFEGKLDSSGKLLVLERLDQKGRTAPDTGSMRISIRPNANFLRYTMTQDLKPSGSAQFAKAIEIGVTKEGENSPPERPQPSDRSALSPADRPPLR